MARKIGLISGPLLFLIIYNLPVIILSTSADKVIAVAVWMIIWWITESVSISVTALIPLTIFPLVGIMDLKSVASSYGSPIVFLFFGGFVMALALEKVNLHRRIALNLVKLTGTSPNRVILGFMLATAFLSMWISNTATTVVMLPIALSVIQLLIHDADGFSQQDKYFALSLMLGIAYAANVGGIATIIGTPPNTVIVGFLERQYQMDISFLKWMMIGVPFSAFMILVTYLLLTKVIYPNNLPALSTTAALIDNEIAKLGPMTGLEKRVLTVFTFTISLWITRIYLKDLIPFISLTDTGISMLASLALFSVPYSFSKQEFVLSWEDTVKLPWGILILFGGGLALAAGLADAGVIEYIGSFVSSNPSWSPLLVGIILIGIVLFMTELMSNVALVAIFAPVVAGIAVGLDQNMLYLLIPTAMASSCAFMLPMATPPNAIVFASGHISVSEMARAGVLLNIISIAVISLFMYWVIPLVF